MFIGEFIHSVDDKGRINIPSKFRNLLGSNFVVSKGLDKCLVVFPEDEWKILENKIKALPLTDKNARSFSRFILGGAFECSPDKQGRVVIPFNLRSYAGVENDVVIIGLSTKIEIWDKGEWDKYNESEYCDIDNIASCMESLGI